jgi:hypothetical protein
MQLNSILATTLCYKSNLMYCINKLFLLFCITLLSVCLYMSVCLCVCVYVCYSLKGFLLNEVAHVRLVKYLQNFNILNNYKNWIKIAPHTWNLAQAFLSVWGTVHCIHKQKSEQLLSSFRNLGCLYGDFNLTLVRSVRDQDGLFWELLTTFSRAQENFTVQLYSISVISIKKISRNTVLV